jgi:hypothetical protein
MALEAFAIPSVIDPIDAEIPSFGICFGIAFYMLEFSSTDMNGLFRSLK